MKIRNRNQKNQNHTDHSIVKIDKNTEESPGYLRRLTITKTPVTKRQPQISLRAQLEEIMEKIFVKIPG